ncbi:hypothetical protein G6F56_013090 [Rhizopus delemar]|nr:hypothetical protein G6F56_013090 [Rhizopus delemar]
MNHVNATNMLSDADRDLMNRFIDAIQNLNEIRTTVSSQSLASQNAAITADESLTPQVVDAVQPSDLFDLLMPGNKEQRIEETIQNPDKYGFRTIPSNPYGAMVAGPNGKLRTPPLADRLTSLVRYLFVDQCGVKPTQTYLEESGRALRSTTRDTYK